MLLFLKMRRRLYYSSIWPHVICSHDCCNLPPFLLAYTVQSDIIPDSSSVRYGFRFNSSRPNTSCRLRELPFSISGDYFFEILSLWSCKGAQSDLHIFKILSLLVTLYTLYWRANSGKDKNIVGLSLSSAIFNITQ